MNPIGFILENPAAFLDGLLTTIWLSLLSFFFALLVGIVIASFRVSPLPPLQRAGSTYVALFRNLPLLIIFFFFFFGLPSLGFVWPSFTTAVVVLALYTGAYLGEAIRSGINSVSTGQAEAARAIGLRFTQVLGLVVLPQAVRTVIAPISNLFIANAKNSAIAFTIGVVDLTGTGVRLGNRAAESAESLAAAALIYVALLIPTGFVFSAIERRVAIKR